MNENFYIRVSGVLKSHFTLAMRSVLMACDTLNYIKKRAHVQFYYIQTKIWPSNTYNVIGAACEVTFLQNISLGNTLVGDPCSTLLGLVHLKSAKKRLN
jgi:hypothetical protein